MAFRNSVLNCCLRLWAEKEQDTSSAHLTRQQLGRLRDHLQSVRRASNSEIVLYILRLLYLSVTVVVDW